METQERDLAEWAYETFFIGMFMAFTAWALVTAVLTFGLIPLSLEELVTWTQVGWVFLFLTLLFMLLAMSAGMWRKR